MTVTDDAVGVPAPPSPSPDIDSAPFWAAAHDLRFELCRCTDCRAWLQPPLERCRHCAGATSFEPASGDGEIYSYIVIRHPSVPAFVHRLPYVVALVQLAEGVRLPGRLLGIEPEEVAVGQQVCAEFETLPGADEPALAFRVISPEDTARG
jgi:uncharacterized OB-fold protein